MFSLVSLSELNFSSRVLIMSFVFLTQAARGSLLLHLSCTRVARVSLVSLLSSTRVVDCTRSFKTAFIALE